MYEIRIFALRAINPAKIIDYLLSPPLSKFIRKTEEFAIYICVSS
jgi:hypothetical protein